MTQLLLLILALFTAAIIAVSFYWNNQLTKFLSLAVFVFLANCVYFSLDGVKGWPAEEPTEIKGVLASVVIVNPTKEELGGIYISLFPTLPKKWYEYEYPRKAPKTYFVEYSNNRAAKFEMGKKAMEEGQEVRINGIPPKESSGEGEESDADSFTNMIGNAIDKVLQKQKDTYKPDVPDIEILAPKVPPQKGTN
jgi:hypothetical protein